MAPCFPLPFHPHHQPTLPSFLKPFCFPSCHGPFSFSSSSSPASPLPFDDDDGADAADSDLNNHHVIILEIQHRAMMKARSRPKSSFMITTADELRRLLKAAAPRKANKAGDAEGREKKDEELEADDESVEEFFSVRSCFSRRFDGDEEYCLWGRTAAAVVSLSEEWLRECEGWPFGLWQGRQVVVLPPLPKSPSDSWTWHKRNLSNVKVWPVWAAAVKQV